MEDEAKNIRLASAETQRPIIGVMETLRFSHPSLLRRLVDEEVTSLVPASLRAVPQGLPRMCRI